MKKGSITIFSLLSMMLVASALFALLETARFQELKRLTQLQTELALEGAFAEYSQYLWEEYHLLACEQKQLLHRIEECGNGGCSVEASGSDFFQFRVKDIYIDGYTRLTDGDGLAFIQAISAYMQKNILYESAKDIYSQYEAIKYLQEESAFSLGDIEKAIKALQQENTSTGSTGQRIGSDSRDSEYVREGENLLESIQKLQKMGILALVIEDTSQLSNGKMDITNVVSKRSLPEGVYPKIEATEWYDRVLLQQYMLTYLSNYMDEKGHVSRYELEYLLGGKSKEIDNLKIAVGQILAIRESANMLYLLNSPACVEQARLLALSIAGASLNPVQIEIVKTAILAAWAFAESILDMRTLLSGGRISLLKSDESWTMDLKKVSTLATGFTKAKSSKNGLSYADYVGVLLLFQKDTTVAKRCMDLQEQTLRQRYNRMEIYMEDWIVEARVRVSYSYRPVFFSIENVVPNWSYQLSTEAGFQY